MSESVLELRNITKIFPGVRALDKVQFDLVGFFDDDYEAQVQSIVDEGIAVFHGFQTEPRPYYAAADCIVMPSYHEGLSNVLLEAAAIGRPVITCDIHGCKETVDDGVSGLLCQVKDEEDLYLKMRRMAELSRGEREAMGLAARRKVERDFEKYMVVQKTMDAVFF